MKQCAHICISKTHSHIAKSYRFLFSFKTTPVNFFSVHEIPRFFLFHSLESTCSSSKIMPDYNIRARVSLLLWWVKKWQSNGFRSGSIWGGEGGGGEQNCMQAKNNKLTRHGVDCTWCVWGTWQCSRLLFLLELLLWCSQFLGDCFFFLLLSLAFALTHKAIMNSSKNNNNNKKTEEKITTEIVFNGINNIMHLTMNNENPLCQP